MAFARPPAHVRIRALLAATAVQAGLAVLLLWGLANRRTPPPRAVPTLVTITPSVDRQPKLRSTPDRPAEAPAEQMSEALPVAAPSPPVALAPPRPAAPAAGIGDQADTGAMGPGTGAGVGAGAGGAGSGAGAASAPLRVAGALSDRDYPHGRRVSGTVSVAFRVRGDGRVDRCAVIGSSAEPSLDTLTCTLVERRFRYRPARDPAGQPVDTVLRASFTWGTRQRD